MGQIVRKYYPFPLQPVVINMELKDEMPFGELRDN